MKVTGWGRPDCDVELLYGLMGVKPYAPTSLKEIRDAARQLGFAAEARQWTVEDLRKTADYAILPIGKVAGTEQDPFHFILVKEAAAEHVIVVNPRTLVLENIPLSFLKDNWSGYALVITPGPGMGPSQNKFSAEPAPGDAKGNYDDVHDFGEVNFGELLRHTFFIAGPPSGEDKPKIVWRSCACLEATLGRDESGSITLAMELRADKPARQEVFAAVQMGQGGPVKRYLLRCHARDSYQTFPRLAHLEVPDTKVVEYPVKVEYYSDPNDVVTFERLESLIAGMRAGPCVASDNSGAAPGIFTFSIPLIYDPSTAAPGCKWLDGTVRFFFATTKGPRVVPLRVSAQVGSPSYVCNPSRVFICAARTNGAVQRRVKVDFLTDVEVDSLKAESRGQVQVRITASPVSRRAVNLSIALDQDTIDKLPDGTHEGFVLLSYAKANTGEKTSIEIPLTISIH
jgi:hypothetical protein